MSLYVRELLLDTIYRALPEQIELEDLHQAEERPRRQVGQLHVGSDSHITRIDLYSAIERTVSRGQITKQHVIVLDRFLSGHPIIDIKLDFPNADSLLIQILSTIEQESCYTDESFMTWALTIHKKYAIFKQALLAILAKRSQQF